MKVGYNNSIMFKASMPVTKPEDISAKQPVTKELKYTAPSAYTVTGGIYPQYNIESLNIKAPQKYSKLGVSKFANGLELHSYKLANGYRVSIIPMEGAPATVKNYVNVGSLNETDDIKGISHFLEHMAFNGTNGENGYIKLETGDSFKKLDSLGGWTNASTGYAVTDYVNSTPLLEEKDLEEQIKIIAGMTEDLALTPEMIEKEKGPVCSEINMILDDPTTISTDQTVRSLFGINSSADELIGGSTKHIKNLTREKVKAYYDKYYTPDNMNLVITGDVDPDKVIELVSKNFHSTKTSRGQKFEEKLTPINKSVRKDIITDKAKSAHITLGFAGPKSNDSKARIINQIISEYLYLTDVGIKKELKNINAYADFGREKVSNNPNNPTLIYCGITCSEENSEKALKIMFDKLGNLKAPSEETLAKIKESILLEYKDATEHSAVINNTVGNAILNDNLDFALNYEEILNSITSDDVKNYIDKYIDVNKTAVTVVHPETTMDKINANHAQASTLTFKGKRVPVNTAKVDEITLNNNFKTVFYETNNDNLDFTIRLNYPPIQNINPAILEVFDHILTMGTMQNNEDSFNKYLEDNNIGVSSYAGLRSLSVHGYSGDKDFEKTFNRAQELLYNPRITEENIKRAVEKIRDSLNRAEDTASSLYYDNEANTNPLFYKKEDILNGLDKVTVDDVKNLHQYIINNACGSIIMNSPKNSDIKDKATMAFENLNNVKPYTLSVPKVYKPNTKSQVLTKEKNVAQADIRETFKYEYNGTPREYALSEIMNTILNSSSIGLFPILREKEHLAYRVSSGASAIGNCGELSCEILTTTDNKEIGEISYDNVKKSINGFNRQINALLNSGYTDEDLESAKRLLKADLLINETTTSKLGTINAGINKPEGVEYLNKVYEEIDKLSREDIQEFAQKVFKNPPIYSIVASKDTLNANKDFFETL